MINTLNYKRINYPLFFLTILPLSFILGPSISLINIVLLSLFFIPEYFRNSRLRIYDKNTLIAFIILYVYLIFNSFISIDYTSGFLRNVGFLRFIFFFLIINLIFFKYGKNNYLFKFWTAIFLLVIIDIYVERLTGSNLLGYGKMQINFYPGVEGMGGGQVGILGYLAKFKRTFFTFSF